MKNKIISILIAILLVIGLIIAISGNNKKVYTEINGIKYAILVDGVSSTTFPSGDNYRVNISCTNANGYWDNLTSKVIIKNIKGNVTCDISFNSITSSDYLNNYLISLSGTIQGEGNFIHEVDEIGDYSSPVIVTSYGTTPVYFQNTSYSSTYQTNTDSYWTFSNGTFTSDPSKFTISGTNNYYHLYAQVPDDGYYKLCYSIAVSSNTYPDLNIALNNTNITSFKPSTSNSTSGCYELGYLLSTDYINISERGYLGTSSPIMTFRLEKAPSTPIDTGYRYEGKNPNNYIAFNNELWRIIGVFETEYDSDGNGTINSSDISGNLVKIIRDDVIGGLTWDKNNNNDWSTSSLYHLLNEQYYDWETNKANVSNYCYYSEDGSGFSASACNYTVKGIQDGYRGMVAKTKWYLGGNKNRKTGYVKYTPSNTYYYERDDVPFNNGRSVSASGYIGLMYASDYGYAVLANYCGRKTDIDSYVIDDCRFNNWLHGKATEWTLFTQSSSSSYVFALGITGCFFTNDDDDYSPSAECSYNVRPVLYLSPSVYRVSGSGTITDPYIIGIPTEYEYFNDGSDIISYRRKKIGNQTIGEEVCILANDIEFCLGNDYVIEGDSDYSLTMVKLKNDIMQTFGYVDEDIQCSDSFTFCSIPDVDIDFRDNNIVLSTTNGECGAGSCVCEIDAYLGHCYVDD